MRAQVDDMLIQNLEDIWLNVHLKAPYKVRDFRLLRVITIPLGSALGDRKQHEKHN